MALNVAALAGGVGGAKLAHGLAAALPPDNLTVIVNTADDFDHLGLHICPDLDTVVYTLAGVANHKSGWGRDRETWNFLGAIGELGGPTWFRLGDRDLALHIWRSQSLRWGIPLSAVTVDVCRALGVRPTVLPMTDDDVRTMVQTDEGEIAFQEYFVRRAFQPAVRGFRFFGADAAQPGPGVLPAIEAADLVVVCPSNPWVSIDPILSIPGVRDSVASRMTVAVSPLVGGKAVKGPAAKMAAELGIEPTPMSIAAHYDGVIRGLVYDDADADCGGILAAQGVRSIRTDTLMRSDGGRRRLAEKVLAFGASLLAERPA
ncbi:MAG TPA: 2-phospho-L-lactate transferase [Anaerolineales bacterium]|nr:2-phospho-L-lactate transferase [Anaerolineales bacterium]